MLGILQNVWTHYACTIIDVNKTESDCTAQRCSDCAKLNYCNQDMFMCCWTIKFDYKTLLFISLYSYGSCKTVILMIVGSFIKVLWGCTIFSPTLTLRVLGEILAEITGCTKIRTKLHMKGDINVSNFCLFTDTTYCTSQWE